MKIVYLTAGAAGMYCGSCLHDNTLAAALIRAGDDVLLVPVYTPIRTDEEDASLKRVFYGGINVALQQKWRIFRHTPWWFDRLFDRPALLAWIGRRGATTNPKLLGELAVSMLQGEKGLQKKELEKLVTWLGTEAQPQLVHLSNSLLSGTVSLLKERLGVPIVCSLSGEDNFIEKIESPFQEQARTLLREHARQIDAFVSLNAYYADFMAQYLDVPRDRIHVIPHGVWLTGYGSTPRNKRTAEDFCLGYLARICPDKGLHLLVEAWEHLVREHDLPPLRLKVAGYLSPGDKPYLDQLEQRLGDGHLRDRYEYAGELNRQQKIAFLESLDVFCVPTVYRESKGLPALEALASGVPVVLPDHGAFPEIVGDTGGGLLFPPHDTQALAHALASLARQPHRARQLGLAGQRAVHERYHSARMAASTSALYHALRGRQMDL
jgi:glycosyltransferase involved in cell wall biosynthesis